MPTEYQLKKLRDKARAAGHKLPSDKPKAKKLTAAQKSAVARSKEMLRLEKEKAALKKRGGRKDPTKTVKKKKAVAKKAPPRRRNAEDMVNELKGKPRGYIKKRK